MRTKILKAAITTLYTLCLIVIMAIAISPLWLVGLFGLHPLWLLMFIPIIFLWSLIHHIHEE